MSALEEGIGRKGAHVFYVSTSKRGWPGVKPALSVLGYRAVAVDFSEEGRFGKNALDVVQHGPLMGLTFNW